MRHLIETIFCCNRANFNRLKKHTIPLILFHANTFHHKALELYFNVATSNGVINLKKVQLSGKKEVSIKDFNNAYQLIKLK
jgi:methionyl-tRNA formyltransferase